MVAKGNRPDSREAPSQIEAKKSTPKKSNVYPPLYSLIENSRWIEATAFCKEQPAEASRWIVRRDKEGNVNMKILPLHEACRRQPTIDIIRSLIEANPDALQSKDQTGRLPLHYACFSLASDLVVKELVEAFPDSIPAARPEDKASVDRAILKIGIIFGEKNGDLSSLDDIIMPETENKDNDSKVLSTESIRDPDQSSLAMVTRVDETALSLEIEMAIEEKCFLETKVELLMSRLTDSSIRSKSLHGEMLGLSADIDSLSDQLEAATEGAGALEKKCIIANNQLGTSLSQKTNLETKSSATQSALLNQAEKLKAARQLETRLQGTVDDLTMKLEAVSSKNKSLESSLSEKKEAIELLDATLMNTKVSQKELSEKSIDLTRVLAETERNEANVRSAHLIATDAFRVHSRETQDKIIFLSEKNASLEKELSVSLLKILQVNRKAEESYLLSSRRVAELERNLQLVLDKKKDFSQKSREEKAILEDKVKHFETSNGAIKQEIDVQSGKAFQRLANLETRMIAAADEYARAMAESLRIEKEEIVNQSL